MTATNRRDCFYKTMNPNNKEINLHHVTENFVFKELNNLNAGKSTGLDGISARFLKDGADILKIPIRFIVNLYISEGCVPGDFKQARVKPLHKKDSKLDVGNYRPVSILSVTSFFFIKSSVHTIGIFFNVKQYFV